MLAPTHRAPNISPAISAERKTSECIGVVRKFHDPTHFFISASLHEFNNTWQPVTSSNVGVDSSKLIRRVGRSSSLQHMMCSNLFWVKTEHKILLPDVRCYFHGGYDSAKANNLKQHLYFRPQVGIEVSPMLRETDRFAMH